MRALYVLCSLLRPEGPRGDAADLVRNNRVKWAPVLSLATEHRLTSALWAALRDAQLVSPVPASVRAFMDQAQPGKRHIAVVLQDSYDETLRRNTDLLGQAHAVTRAFNDAGITPMPLKGLSHLITGLITDPGARFMHDVDLLVPPGDIDTARHVVETLGYAESADGDQEAHHHGRPYLRADSYGSLELHHAPLGGPATPLLTVEALWASASPFDWDGLRLRLPPPTMAALHSILNAQIADRMYAGGMVPLRSLHEIALLDASRQIDWREIRQQMDKLRLGHVFDVHIEQLHRLFGRRCRQGTALSLRARAHHARCLVSGGLPAPWQRALRSVTDVRYDLSAQRMRELFPGERASTARLLHLKRKARLLVRPTSGARRL